MSMLRSSRAALAALIGVSLAGSADVGQFLLTRAAMFTDAPERAAGAVVGLAVWVALLLVSAARFAGEDRRAARSATLGLAGLVAAGNLGLAAIHVKAGIGGWRPILGGVLGALALGLAIASRDRPARFE